MQKYFKYFLWILKKYLYLPKQNQITMKTKHTKGEWHAIEFAGIWMVLDAPFYEGKDVLNEENFSKREVEANAKLISAAPQLLDALIKMKEYYIHEKTIDEWELEEMIELTEKAINKATK